MAVMNHSKNMKNSTEESQSSLLRSAFRHYSLITSRVLAATVGTVAVLGIPAYFLDQWFGTWPWIFGIALILSLPISQIILVRLMQDYLKNNPQN